MKRLVGIMLLGVIFFVPLAAQAVVLVVSTRDPATVSSYEGLTVPQRESSLAEVGDFISIRNDDWTLDDSRFGKRVCKNHPPANGGNLVCVELCGISYIDALPLLSYLTTIAENGESDIKRFRRFRINWEGLPESVRNEAFYTGMVSLGYAEWQRYLVDKGGAK